MLVDLDFTAIKSATYYEKIGEVFNQRLDRDHENWKQNPDLHRYMMSLTDDDFPYIVRLDAGIYKCGLNFEYEINRYSDFEVTETYTQFNVKTGKLYTTEYVRCLFGQGSSSSHPWGETIGSYGVSDDIQQVLTRYAKVIENNGIVISFTEIRKDHQPPSGGWRWHKWGEYIGKQNPQYEYLADEPDIESVYVFHVHAVVPKD